MKWVGCREGEGGEERMNHDRCVALAVWMKGDRNGRRV